MESSTSFDAAKVDIIYQYHGFIINPGGFNANKAALYIAVIESLMA
ncbi:MAG: hypothetical protein ABIV51_00160 [Saprospiraceae bacterium]